MISVLVGHSYFLRFDQKQLQRAKPYPPLATLQVAADLRNRGYEVALFDAMLAENVDEYRKQFDTFVPALALFYEDNYNFLSKMCLRRMREATFDMMAHARSRGARVIVAGSDATDAQIEYLQAGADVVLIGEGLAALRSLLPRLQADPQIANEAWVDGIGNTATLRAGSLYRPTARAFGPQKQHPARPAWDLVHMERYREVWQQAHGYFSLNMAASRGCSFRCNWCAKPIWGNTYLQREADDVAAEMALLKREFAPDHIWFADDIFGFRTDWVKRFGEHISRLRGSVPFTIQTRADLISPDMANALREANCQEVWIGAESGSQRVLDQMNKGTTLEEIHLARQRLRDANIRVGFFIQLGYLGEELDDILATRRLVAEAQPDDVGVSVSYPLPGTKFYETVKEQLKQQTHWQESNDLAMMFEGAYSSEFYRLIRDLLHEEVLIHELRDTARATYVAAKASLDDRWTRLLLEEQRFRSPPAQLRSAAASIA